MASTYLTRTPSSTGSQQKVTFSVWIKRCTSGGEAIYSIGGAVNQNYYVDLTFNSDFLEMNWYDGSGNHTIRTNRLFRDNSAWYNLVVAIDTTQSTASNRVKIYVNGIQETSFSSTEYMNQNQNMLFNTSSREIRIGQKVNGSGSANMIMSHFHGIDGTAYDASYFGSTDSVTGEWKINTSPSVTYGTNGFFILKDGNSVTDQSGNGNNYTVGNGTLTKTEDNPSNVFATFNPLYQTLAGTNVYSSGNTDLTSATDANEFHGASTLAMTSGKYYAEFKMKNGQFNTVGITSTPSNDARTNVSVRTSANSYGLYSYNGKLNEDTYASSYTAPNVIGVAVDLDNNKIYFSKDGNWSTGSGAWGSTTWSAGTGAYTITDPSLTVEGAYFFAIGEASGGSSGLYSANFGNGYFGTTAVSSAGTNASGNGIFEYDVPTGFTALSTKGLNL